MGLLGKLAFWKKKDEFGDLPDIGKGFGQMPGDMGLPPLGENTPGTPQAAPPGMPATPGMPDFGQQFSPQQSLPESQSAFGQPPPFEPTPLPTPMAPKGFQSPAPMPEHDGRIEQHIEIVSYKLDALKASLDAINQRLANIERIANQSQQSQW